jgi:hypothetical protein
MLGFSKEVYIEKLGGAIAEAEAELAAANRFS